MKKLLFVFALCLAASIPAVSQSPRTVLLEHFTNTRCSICASKNPAFYQTLSGYPQVLHISFHPSAPYSQCQFSLQNPTENDNRTTFYNAYGSTPKVAMNGKILPASSSLISSATLDAAINQTSPIQVSAFEKRIGADSIMVKVVVRTTGAITQSNVRLYVGVAENPVSYNAPNGENIHHDVFRKALTAPDGNSITLPMLNDSIVVEFVYTSRKDWNINNIYSLAFVQRTDTKEVLNVGKSIRVLSNPNSVMETNDGKFSILSNHVSNKLIVTGFNPSKELSYSIFDVVGHKIYEGSMSSSEIDVSNLITGIYYVRLENVVKKFVKQ